MDTKALSAPRDLLQFAAAPPPARPPFLHWHQTGRLEQAATGCREAGACPGRRRWPHHRSKNRNAETRPVSVGVPRSGGFAPAAESSRISRWTTIPSWAEKEAGRKAPGTESNHHEKVGAEQPR